MRSSGKKHVETEDLNDKTIINKIMMKFRPIAPKPMTLTSSDLVPLKLKRTKRKYVRVKKKNNIVNEDNKWMFKVCNRFIATENDSVATDLLQREWLSFNSSEKINNNNDAVRNLKSTSVDLHDVDLTAKAERGHVARSWITVESVTGACEDWRRRCTDEEIWKDLDMDSCPGFISNGCYEVTWVNLAYRTMVDPNYDGESMMMPEVVVVLEVKMDKMCEVEYWPAFSCRVRVVYRLSEKLTKQMMVPCDVWKMDSGGYAWRLDVKAALSLGRLN
ncbi:uncharacterized protein [Rutidosis leptorrhynchoides]|uniref:uncharacterized protein n=1 Tax=Rutidosis leptorrhynchoides TaxID=125765 RepID=UPI003A994372